jgi:glycosyltransferase involved in cell wall biosynthesis
MTVVAITMVRDEEDIIDWTLQHLLEQGIDHIIVADNLSVDETPWKLAALASTGKVTVIQDDEPGYYQDEKMTRLAHMAANDFGAEWVVPFDADEYWYWTDGTLAEFFSKTTADIITATGWDHIATDDDDPTEPSPFRRIIRRRQAPQKMGKVAFRYHPDIHIDFGNHFLFNHPGRQAQALNYRHYQYRSFEQLVTKARNGAAAYNATTLHPTYGAHWRQLGEYDDRMLWAIWRKLCEEPGLVNDPAPTP